MFEKVNASHPDKIADRLAGAIVDYAYSNTDDPKIAVEVLLGHGTCYIIIETSIWLDEFSIEKLVRDRVKVDKVVINQVQQDPILAHNQETLHCGDNGIFKGVPISLEERELTYKVRLGYEKCPYDGKYILDDNFLIACQSNTNELPFEFLGNYKFNPLGNWTGGIEVDSGATNRKIGSDMGRAATGGGLFGKDTSKADVSVNIWAHLQAQKLGYPIECVCAIGDTSVCVIEPSGERYFVPFATCVNVAKEYIAKLGGFEKFAEWGLIR